MKIRRMTLGDFSSCYALWQQTTVELQSYEKEQKEVAQMLLLNPDSCFVGIHQGKIIGTVLGIFNGRRGWIYHLAILPQYQKKGYGSLLLQQTEETLLKRGASVVLLWLEYTNLDKLPFYLKKDYAVYHDALALRKKLTR